MKRIAKEGQIVIAGYVGKVDKKNDNLCVVSISNKKSKEETEWLYVAFSNPQQGKQGTKLCDLASNYIEKGQFVVVVANESINGEYKNLYATAVELGPKKKV